MKPLGCRAALLLAGTLGLAAIADAPEPSRVERKIHRRPPEMAPLPEGSVVSGRSLAPTREPMGLRGPAPGIEAFGRLPLAFEANAGQTDSRVKFLSRAGRYNVFLTATEAVLVLPGPGPAGAERPGKGEPRGGRLATAVRMRLIGANPEPEIAGHDPLPGKSNYLLDKDPSKWRTRVPQYGRVAYRDVYPGVDLVYYGNGTQLEYDFVVAPGGDPANVRLGFEGVDKLEIDSQGDLVLRPGGNPLRLRKPDIYQEVDGSRRPIEGGYVLRASGAEGHEVSVHVASYDASRPLVIDPVTLYYGTFLGGSGDDGAANHGVAVDPSGSVYLCGDSSSTDFPTTPGAFQTTPAIGWVAKINASGDALLYSTYLPRAEKIAVDSSGNAYVVGSTTLASLPTTPGAFQPTLNGPRDVFVTKLNPTGTGLVYSTYLGGSGTEGYGQTSVAVDSGGNVYVTGDTDSTDFPTTPAAFQRTYGGGVPDAFVTKLNPTGTGLVYSTYLGGSGEDATLGIAIDSSGNAYVTGETRSTDFPLRNPIDSTCDACPAHTRVFVTKVNADGSDLVYSTYLGGSTVDDLGQAIAVDSAGQAYVAGGTGSADFPTTPGAFQTTWLGRLGLGDAFVTKFNAAGTALVYSTFLGGTANDPVNAIAVDASGNAYVAGQTDSSDFPTANAFQPNLNGVHDVSSTADGFIAKLNASGSALIYSSYMGGSGYDNARGIELSPSGNAYVVGSTTSANFPTTANGFQTSFGGVEDAFLVKIGSAPTWASAGSLNRERYGHTLTLLGDGRVLATGGNDNSSVLASAELFDPIRGTWTLTGSLGVARRDHTATFLGSGKVLVAGGSNGSPLASAELYDPSTGTWGATGDLSTARSGHTATLLRDGRVLVAGGGTTAAELYDPTVGSWSPTGPLATPRAGHTATLLLNGSVLVAGGGTVAAELYDPAAATWSTAGTMATTRSGHSATLLPNGKVLVVGGDSGGPLPSAELYDPASNTWTVAGPMLAARSGHAAALPPGGNVVVVGGQGASGKIAQAESYDPAGGAWAPVGTLSTARSSGPAVLLPDGRVLVAWRQGAGRAGTWRSSHWQHRAVPTHGRALVSDGRDGRGPVQTRGDAAPQRQGTRGGRQF